MFQEDNYITHISISIKEIVLSYHFKISVVSRVVPYNQPIGITAQVTRFPKVCRKHHSQWLINAPNMMRYFQRPCLSSYFLYMGLTEDLPDLGRNDTDSPQQQEGQRMIESSLAQLEPGELALFCAEQIFSVGAIYRNIQAISCVITGGALPRGGQAASHDRVTGRFPSNRSLAFTQNTWALVIRLL